MALDIGYRTESSLKTLNWPDAVHGNEVWDMDRHRTTHSTVHGA